MGKYLLTDSEMKKEKFCFDKWKTAPPKKCSTERLQQNYLNSVDLKVDQLQLTNASQEWKENRFTKLKNYSKYTTRTLRTK